MGRLTAAAVEEDPGGAADAGCEHLAVLACHLYPPYALLEGWQLECVAEDWDGAGEARGELVFRVEFIGGDAVAEEEGEREEGEEVGYCC